MAIGEVKWDMDKPKRSVLFGSLSTSQRDRHGMQLLKGSSRKHKTVAPSEGASTAIRIRQKGSVYKYPAKEIKDETEYYLRALIPRKHLKNISQFRIRHGIDLKSELAISIAVGCGIWPFLENQVTHS